ncbi:hypothetical protein [Acinetobacter sp. FDAARGOS_131]|nr:hypothetical protein [Acinetobacter sp. FDAARGOS_131]
MRLLEVAPVHLDRGFTKELSKQQRKELVEPLFRNLLISISSLYRSGA